MTKIIISWTRVESYGHSTLELTFSDIDICLLRCPDDTIALAWDPFNPLVEFIAHGYTVS